MCVCVQNIAYTTISIYVYIETKLIGLYLYCGIDKFDDYIFLMLHFANIISQYKPHTRMYVEGLCLCLCDVIENRVESTFSHTNTRTTQIVKCNMCVYYYTVADVRFF